MSFIAVVKEFWLC